MKLILLFVVSFCIFSCKKSITDQKSLIGTWTIKETLSDPGDGSGKWEPVSTGETLNFKSDGTISGTALGNIKSYKIIDSIRIQFIEANDNTYICRFLINAEYLEINPPCRERCGSRFKR